MIFVAVGNKEKLNLDGLSEVEDMRIRGSYMLRDLGPESILAAQVNVLLTYSAFSCMSLHGACMVYDEEKQHTER